MPTYEYKCTACGHAFEHFQSMSDKTLRTCPKCSKKKLVRQVGAGAGLIFKGTGWYATDYRKSSPASSESKESESKTPSDTKATSDSKAPSDKKTPSEPKAPATSKGGETSTGGKGRGKPASGPAPGGSAAGGGGKDA